jgi:hypothetical protein
MQNISMLRHISSARVEHRSSAAKYPKFWRVICFSGNNQTQMTWSYASSFYSRIAVQSDPSSQLHRWVKQPNELGMPPSFPEPAIDTQTYRQDGVFKP